MKLEDRPEGLQPLGALQDGEVSIKGGDFTPLSVALLEVWDNRGVLRLLVRRHLAIRYSQTVLGLGWLVVQPLGNSLAFAILLSLVSQGGGRPLDVFLAALCGFVPWTAFAQGSERAAMCLTWDERLITKVYFPRLLLPIAAVGSAIVDIVVPLGLLVGIVLATGAPRWEMFPLLGLAIALIVATSLGLGLLLSSASLALRDLRQVQPFLFQMLLILSPVVYPIGLVPEGWRGIAQWNPIATVTSSFRAVFLDHPAPTMEAAVVSSMISVGFLLVGLLAFLRVEPRMADLL